MKVYISLLAGLVLTAHCGTTGIYDEATTNYVRIVRSGLNEWYPLNGNLSSKIGSADGTATGTINSGVSRSGDSGKTVCMISVRADFASNRFGAIPFTSSLWVKLNAIPGSINTVWQKGTASTFWNGYRFNQQNATGFDMSVGNGSSGVNLTSNFISAGTWYYVALSYSGTASTLYIAPYGGSMSTYGPTAGSYLQNAAAMQLNAGSTLDMCVDDLLNYNRALTAAEVQQNFQSLE